MDRFGFNKALNEIKSQATPNFLLGAIKLEQEEMKENFESESANGDPWKELVYRNVPPPILDLEGELKSGAIENLPKIEGNKAVLIIDPIDSRGKGYAEFHQQDGSGETATKGTGDYGKNVKREFMTQSPELDEKQKNLLINELNKVFK